jgi:serine/threonine protein kinase
VTNTDGRTSAQLVFQILDLNGNGILEEDEWRHWMEQVQGTFTNLADRILGHSDFGGVDTDNSGGIDVDEWCSYLLAVKEVVGSEQYDALLGWFLRVDTKRPLAIEWLEDFDARFSVEETIAEQAHSRVLKVRARDSGRAYAVKIEPKEAPGLDECTARDLLERVLALPEHECIIKVHAIYEDAGSFYTVQDVCKGDLHDFLSESRRCEPEELPRYQTKLRSLMADIFFALSHLHKHGLVHNDVKLENVLFQHPEAEEQAVGGGARGKLMRAINNSRAPRGKLIDFDHLRPASALAQGVLGTDGYVAPEAYELKPCAKSDVFSAGVLMYALVEGTFPFPEEIFVDTAETNFEGSLVLANIHRDLRRAHEALAWDSPLWEALPEARDFCARLLTFEVKDRPTPDEALRHSWLRKAPQFCGRRMTRPKTIG